MNGDKMKTFNQHINGDMPQDVAGEAGGSDDYVDEHIETDEGVMHLTTNPDNFVFDSDELDTFSDSDLFTIATGYAIVQDDDWDPAEGDDYFNGLLRRVAERFKGEGNAIDKDCERVRQHVMVAAIKTLAEAAQAEADGFHVEIGLGHIERNKSKDVDVGDAVSELMKLLDLLDDDTARDGEARGDRSDLEISNDWAKTATITPHQARVVLDVTGFHKEYEGYSGGFESALVQAALRADLDNLARLALGFEGLVAAVILYQQVEHGVEFLEERAEEDRVTAGNDTTSY